MENQRKVLDFFKRQPAIRNPRKRPQNASTHATSSSSKGRKVSDPKRMQQMFLDLGQKSFGKHESCPKCGFFYVSGADGEDREHLRFCRSAAGAAAAAAGGGGGGGKGGGGKAAAAGAGAGAAGVPFKGWRNERRVREFPDGGARILQVRPGDPAAHRRKLAEVKALADADMGFAPGQAVRTAYLYVEGGRAVGALTAEPLARAWPARGSAPPAPPASADGAARGAPHPTAAAAVAAAALLSAVPLLSEVVRDPARAVPAEIGVHQVWVCPRARRRGVARRLLEAARTTLIWGRQVPRTRVAFSQPTAAGFAFAQQWYRTTGTNMLHYLNEQEDCGGTNGKKKNGCSPDGAGFCTLGKSEDRLGADQHPSSCPAERQSASPTGEDQIKANILFTQKDGFNSQEDDTAFCIILVY